MGPNYAAVLVYCGNVAPLFFRQTPGGRAEQETTASKTLRRVLVLWILGMVAQGNLLDFDLSKLYLFSNTLQAIAVGYLVASLR